MKRRRKLNTFNMQTSDVANFNDFADVMPNIEMKFKVD